VRRRAFPLSWPLMCDAHEPSPALGRVMLSTMLVAHGIKDQETLQFTFNGNGLAKGVLAISDGACNVRGWIGNTDLDELKDPETGFSNIKGAVGEGTLQVGQAGARLCVCGRAAEARLDPMVMVRRW
jgi:hypothetical protein